MEARVSEILENILSLLGLEGSFEVVEGPEEVAVSIETEDPGRLIGFRGETLDALQLIVNQILGKQLSSQEDSKEQFKRVVIDVADWRKNKEGDLERRARSWAQEVQEKGSPIELDPMPSWQRRIIHMIISEIGGVSSESVGEGKDRHLIISPADEKAAGQPGESTEDIPTTTED
ncbi:KH domain-containing protein [Patescibacteria group bacterium]|nr:KH domain-containing protein [Patescibacteria group bacterium]MCL5410201.1 KH domain-containing protein [Patescibacteria group bacterium]